MSSRHSKGRSSGEHSRKRSYYDGGSDASQRKQYNRHRERERADRDPARTDTPLCEQWDGYFQDSDSIHFDLTFNWKPFKSTICRMVFGRGGWLNPGTVVADTHNEFWAFVSRFLSKIAQQARVKGSIEKFELKEALKRFHCRPKHFNIVNRYRYIRSDNNDVPELSSDVLKSVHYFVLCYIDFLEKQELQKLRKLRQSQANLPIANYRQRILDALHSHSLVVVSGDTGCGKSTQVPQYLLKAGFDKICCTQPRRIACISLSKRVAFETLNEYGSQVAYQIRFEKTKTAHTRIVFMTEGLLLRQIGTDPLLSQYDVLVLDEVHERHLHSDFLLGVVRCLMEQRQNLKIILMSATINIELFATYFNDAPVIQVPGRLFPIQVVYTPVSVESRSSSSARLNPLPYVRILQMIDKKYSEKERGDVLMFLSGINEITTVVEAANEYAQQTRRWIILPLHSSLSLREQDKVFDIAPDGIRKCVIATNIAETSITIDGIRFVIDSGRVKEMSHDHKYRMQRLQEFWISQASAEQRRGRAGRTGPGVCYRMYQQSDYDEFSPYSTPEIQRVPLDSLLLQMIAMGLTEVRKFPFIEPPDDTAIEQSLSNLKSHNAITTKEEITPMGKSLAKLPLDVMIGKILVSGSLILRLLEPVLFITAGLSVQSPFTNRAFRDLESQKLLEQLFSDHGDALCIIRVFHAWLEEKRRQTDKNDNTKRWCRKRGVEEQRLYEMTKLTGQFREILQEHGLLDMKKILEESLTDRWQRKGELKQLRFLKRTAQKTSKSRKMLSLEEDAGASDQEKDSDEVDIQNIDFQLQNDRSNVDDMFDATTDLTQHENQILKMILCSGLYPNIAIADECNSYKVGQDQIFHTKSKPYVVLHPTSIFALRPEILLVSETEIFRPTDSAGLTRRESFSEGHQLLFYVSLLETNKPYLMNCMRVPALHTMLLFASSIDSNGDCSRLVFDGWIEMHVHNIEDAQSLLEAAIWIREIWNSLLTLRLLESEVSATEFGRKSNKTSKSLERDLVAKLTNFAASPVLFSIKRLLAADMKLLYVGTSESFSSNLPESLHVNIIKGGVTATPYFTYQCLAEKERCTTDCSWTCSNCDQSFKGSVLERVMHFTGCISAQPNLETSEKVDDDEKPRSALAKEYACSECGKTLLLTPAEILKHRKTHV
ncbi:probable ATP-dependent RNA helicase DHX34 [Paramacrobiotus metropolitanus]|uniref:probable ATP-dependent RNA helicase DHX34 n=1 Tax=Paramacrobiotus metropolitanus TaxID=2943436 RepID=UPI0024460A08|nr:probable ATP-dependent RNA helicase DHX34 [Paramacrobiotus metropolitanus]